MYDERQDTENAKTMKVGTCKVRRLCVNIKLKQPHVGRTGCLEYNTEMKGTPSPGEHVMFYVTERTCEGCRRGGEASIMTDPQFRHP